jgi:hypothetical protein
MTNALGSAPVAFMRGELIRIAARNFGCVNYRRRTGGSPAIRGCPSSSARDIKRYAARDMTDREAAFLPSIESERRPPTSLRADLALNGFALGKNFLRVLVESTRLGDQSLGFVELRIVFQFDLVAFVLPEDGGEDLALDLPL